MNTCVKSTRGSTQSRCSHCALVSQNKRAGGGGEEGETQSEEVALNPRKKRLKFESNKPSSHGSWWNNSAGYVTSQSSLGIPRPEVPEGPDSPRRLLISEFMP